MPPRCIRHHAGPPVVVSGIFVDEEAGRALEIMQSDSIR